MAEASQYTIPYTELAALAVKHLDIHEGYWSIFVRFGIQAANMSLNNAPHVPTAIVPILEIGVNRDKEPGPLAVDAAAVNPQPKRTSSKKAKKRAKK